MATVKTTTTGKRTPSISRTTWLPKVGDNVFVRTVTHYFTGRITEINQHWIALDDAAWIADTGRFAAALSTGSLLEVEPFPGPVVVARGSVIDVAPWAHELPREVK